MDDGMRLFQAMARMMDERRERLHLTQRALGDPQRAIEPLAQRLDEKTERLQLAWTGFFERRTGRMIEAAAKLRHPRDIVLLAVQRLANAEQKISFAWRETLTHKKNRLENFGTVLGHLSPRAVLGRGYALVQNRDGQVIISSKQAKSGDNLQIEFYDGKTDVVVK
jgi:exodeoxyribonuclease VII large subunit